MDEIILLNRVRVDIGNISGSLSELMQYATLKGFNDNYEPLEKPRLVGTWTVNNYTSLYLLDLSRSLFDGLTINCSDEWIIDFNDLAVLTLDSTQPNYNPAAAIILYNHNKGILLDVPVIYNQNGRWFLTKTQASLISSIGKWFLSATTVVDNDKICGLNADSYNFTGFNEFEYFTGTGSSLTEGTFSGCTLLLTIKLPSNITTLNTNSNHSTSGTFSNCTSLDVPVTVFNNITYIDNTYEHVSSGNNFINSGCFNNCLSLKWQALPPNLTYIGYCAFNNCNNLLLNCTLNFVTQVRMKAFSGCSKIIYIELPSVTYLSYLAFAGCTLLTEIQLSESLNLIRESAFLNCSNLNIDHLPNNLVTLELNAFLNCSSLTLSTLPLTLQTIGNRAFEGCTLSVSSLPSSLINIHDWAFGNQTNMHLGDHISCNVIGNHAFYGVNFPSNLTISTLELETYRVALGLPSPAISSDFITLNNVTKIGTTAFSQYNIFKSTSIVHITVDTPPNLIAPGFLNVAKIYIGNGLASHDESVIDDYAIASNWLTLYNNGKLLPWYLHEHTPALQSYDSSAPNYYPALCICFEQAGYGRYITTNNKTKGWYMSDEEAASITNTGDVLKNKSTVTDVNGICGTVGATYTLTSADLSAFTNIESIDLSGSSDINAVNIANNVSITEYALSNAHNFNLVLQNISFPSHYDSIKNEILSNDLSTSLPAGAYLAKFKMTNSTKFLLAMKSDGIKGNVPICFKNDNGLYSAMELYLDPPSGSFFDFYYLNDHSSRLNGFTYSDSINYIEVGNFYIKNLTTGEFIGQRTPYSGEFLTEWLITNIVKQCACQIAVIEGDKCIYNFKMKDGSVVNDVNYAPAIKIPDYSKIGNFTYNNCTNIDYWNLLKQFINTPNSELNSINITLPNTFNGPIEDLISIAALWNNQSGENSNLKISGNYIVNNAYVTTSQCENIGYNPQGSHTLTSSKIYGLNITINDIVPDISTIVLQSFDSTKDLYNPAVSIKLENAGYGSYLDTNDKTKGWYLTKEAAAAITTLPSFNAFNQASDVNGICGTVGARYNFTSFDELELFIGLTVIEGNQFRQCGNLTSIKFPPTIVSIGGAAFFSTPIQSIVIPSSTTSIGSYAFNMCTSLTTVTIYSQLTELSGYVFKQCTSLNDLYCYTTIPPTVGPAALDQTPNLSHIYVPAESVSAYKTAYTWSDFANIIEAIPSN